MVPLPYSLAIGALLLAAVGAGGYWRGHTSADRECEAARNAEALQYATEFEQEVARGNEIAAKYEGARRLAQQRARELAIAARNLEPCGHPPEQLVRLHDAAASQTSLPEATGESACKTSPVTHADLARVVAENYSACHSYRDQLNALIDYHEGGNHAPSAQD